MLEYLEYDLFINIYRDCFDVFGFKKFGFSSHVTYRNRRQNVRFFTMGCRFISMLFLIVLLSLSFVECFPLSEKDRDWYKTMDLIDMRNFGRQIIEDDFVLKQHATTENLNSDISGGTQKVDIEVQNLTKDVLDAYKYKTNSTRLLHRHKRYSMSFQSVHNSLRPYLDPNFDPFYNAHVMPCSYEFRNYCLNNGICAVVRALDIKTCR